MRITQRCWKIVVLIACFSVFGLQATAQNGPMQKGTAPPPAQLGNQQPSNQNMSNAAAQPHPPEPGPKGMSEAMVLSALHQINQEEIAAGGLAVHKGTTYHIKMLGDLLQRDHERADSMLMDYARRYHITLLSAQPENSQLQQMKQKGQNTLNQLQSADGEAFDAAFLADMQKGHDAAISMLAGARQNLKADEPIRKFATKIIPILQQHYMIASQLRIESVWKRGV